MIRFRTIGLLAGRRWPMPRRTLSEQTSAQDGVAPPLPSEVGSKLESLVKSNSIDEAMLTYKKLQEIGNFPDVSGAKAVVAGALSIGNSHFALDTLHDMFVRGSGPTPEVLRTILTEVSSTEIEEQLFSLVIKANHSREQGRDFPVDSEFFNLAYQHILIAQPHGWPGAFDLLMIMLDSDIYVQMTSIHFVLESLISNFKLRGAKDVVHKLFEFGRCIPPDLMSRLILESARLRSPSSLIDCYRMFERNLTLIGELARLAASEGKKPHQLQELEDFVGFGVDELLRSHVDLGTIHKSIHCAAKGLDDTLATMLVDTLETKYEITQHSFPSDVFASLMSLNAYMGKDEAVFGLIKRFRELHEREFSSQELNRCASALSQGAEIRGSKIDELFAPESHGTSGLNLILRTAAYSGDPLKSIRLYDTYIKSGKLRPNDETFSCILTSALQLRPENADELALLVVKDIESYNVLPEAETFRLLTLLLIRANRSPQALAMIENAVNLKIPIGVESFRTLARWAKLRNHVEVQSKIEALMKKLRIDMEDQVTETEEELKERKDRKKLILEKRSLSKRGLRSTPLIQSDN